MWNGEARLFSLLHESLVDVQASNVEAELNQQHVKEAEHVIHGLGERVGDQVEAPAGQLAQRLDARLVPRGELIRVRGRPLAQNALRPAARIRPGLAEYVSDAFVAFAQLRADQFAMVEFEAAQMILDGSEILVVQLGLEHPEEPHETIGLELVAMLVGNSAKSLQHLNQHPHDVYRAAQDPTGRIGAAPDFPVALHGFNSKVVHPSDNLRVRQTIPQNVLAVGDRGGVIQTTQHCLLCYRKQEWITL